MEVQNVWIISKYTKTPDDGGATRPYFMAKALQEVGCKATMIYSRSNGNVNQPKFEGGFQIKQAEPFTTILLNGPTVAHGFSIKRIWSWLVFEFNLLRNFRKIAKGNKPDVVIVSSLSLLTILMGLVIKKAYKAKFILEIRDIWPLTLIEIGGFSKNNLFIRFLRAVEKLGYNKADAIVGTMPKLDDHVKASISKPFQYKYIPMGYDKDLYNDAVLQKELPEKLKSEIPKNKFIVGYAGAIGKVNLVEEIIEAAISLRERAPHISFAILGDGPEKENLIKKVDQLALENVVFLPKVPKTYVNAFLMRCDLLLHLVNDEAIYRFGVSPNKWIDYMYSGKPILITYNGYRSIINDAGCGTFIEANKPGLLAEEIVRFSEKNKEELQQMGQKGKNYLLKNLSYTALADEYLKLFKLIS